MPKLSIIVPVYNAEKVIERCIDSIINQDYEDYEAIVIDDGSTDNSPNILDEYAKKYDYIKVIHKENTGVSDTRNTGLKLAKGKYIQFIDCDDWLNEVAMKSLVRVMEDTNCDLVVADFYRVIGNNISRKGNINIKDSLTLEEYAEWMMEAPADYYYGVIWNKLYKKEIIDKYNIKMDVNLSFCEDFVFNLEYLIHCKTITPLQIPIYYYVKTEGSLVSQNLNIPNIVKMKTSIYEYYNNFYKNILDEDDYENDRINIAKFLIASANDDAVISILPSTKKLGEENIHVYYTSDNNYSLIDLLYYSRKLIEKHLNIVALEYNLDIKDILVFYSIERSDNSISMKEIGDFTQLSQTQILMSLQKLVTKKYIKAKLDKLPLDVEITENAKGISDSLKMELDEIYKKSFKGIEEDTAKIYSNIIESIK